MGEGVTDFAIGDRVMALPISGAMAEKVCVAATMCHKLPDDVSDKLAAGLQMTHGTALYALVERGAISKGDTVLVLGAAGGVGLAAVEIATALGARVIAAVSSEDKLEVARAHGAEDGVIYPQGPLDRDAQKALSSAFRDKLGADGADIVVDTVGGDFAEPALRATGWLGRYLVIGFPAGIPKFPANLPLLKSCDIRGVFWGAAVRRDIPAHHRAMDRLLQMCADGRIAPRIHAEYPLERAAEAIEELAARTIMGKVLVTA